MRSVAPASDQALEDTEADRALNRKDIFLICFCVAAGLVDGYDSQVIAFAAPYMQEELTLSSSILGWVFSAGLIGGMFGAVPAAHLEMKFGRRAVLMLCLFWISIGSIITSLISTGPVLVVIRFFAGIGLGMAMPLLFGAMMDSVPRKVRARSLSLVMCAIPAGGLCGGLFSATISSQFGWRPLFWIGCVLPILLLPSLFAAIPRERRPAAADAPVSESAQEKAAGGVIRSLLKAGGIAFAIIFVTNIFSAGLGYILMSWTPTLLVYTGFSKATAALSGGLLMGGAMVAFLILGFLVDRLGPFKVAIPAYAGAALSILCLGLLSGDQTTTMVLCFLAGFFGVGSQVTITYIVGDLVPTQYRVAAFGTAMISSRIGAGIGPLSIGFMSSAGLTPMALFAVMAVLGLIGSVGVFLSNRARREAQ